MRRVHAVVLIAALFAAPLALLARGGVCCEQTCCSKQCCLPKTHHAAAERAGGKMACHHQSPPMPDCAMKAACNHTLDYGFASPLPPTVLQAADISFAPHAVGSARSADLLTFPSGFVATPFEPPRS